MAFIPEDYHGYYEQNQQLEVQQRRLSFNRPGVQLNGNGTIRYKICGSDESVHIFLLHHIQWDLPHVQL